MLGDEIRGDGIRGDTALTISVGVIIIIKHAYVGVNDCFTHLRALLVLQALRHFGPRN